MGEPGLFRPSEPVEDELQRRGAAVQAQNDVSIWSTFSRHGYCFGPLRHAVSCDGPLPIADLRHIITVCGDVLFVLDQLIAYRLLRIGREVAKLGHAIDDILDPMEAVQIIPYHHVERRRVIIGQRGRVTTPLARA